MTELFIILMIFLGSAIMLQVALYTFKDDTNYGSLVFLANFIFSMGISWVFWTTTSSDLIMKQSIAVIYGLVGVLALIIKLNKKHPRHVEIAKVLLTLSITASVASIVI